MIVNYYPGGSVDKIGTPLRYTGSFFVKIDENNQDNWECHLLTSGTLTTEKSVAVDIFLVGGGGGGGGGVTSILVGGGGGGSGHTFSTTDETGIVTLSRGVQYSAVIGDGGSPGTNGSGASSLRAEGTPGGSGGSTSFSELTTGGFSYSVLGGQGGGGGIKPAEGSGNAAVGGGGGSGERSGGKGCYYGSGDNAVNATRGAPNPKYSAADTINSDPVYYFHEEGQECCAGGGAGGGGYATLTSYSAIAYGGIGGGGSSGQSGIPHTGGGGGGGGGCTGIGLNLNPGAGASGVIIIRNHRSAT